MPKLFQKPISKDAPPGRYPHIHHSQPPVGYAGDGPVQTNNTFNNMLLGDQTSPVWPLPYLLWITKDGESDWGLAFNHTEKNQLVFGPEPDKIPVNFYFNPPRIKLMAFTGKGWGKVAVSLKNNDKLSAVAELTNGNAKITVPMAYGMGFVTGLFENMVPVLHSQVGFQEFKTIGVDKTLTKYLALLFNQIRWTIYSNAELQLADPNHVMGTREGTFIVQVCKGDNAAYDQNSGKYPVGVTLVGSTDGSRGSYSFKYDMKGDSSGPGLVWCLPHHQVTLTDAVKKTDSGMQLDSPTKGPMRAYATDTLAMEICDLPDIGFEPWTSVSGFGYDSKNYTEDVKNMIEQAARKEVEDDVAGQCDLDSMYFGGKQLDKYAYIAYVTNFILRNSELTQKILPKVKKAIEKYAKNEQKNPLQYDQTWKGLISSAKSDQDFGNSNYNDHHFHYGYHVHAIALVARIDPRWLEENEKLVLNYALTLVRDYANPSTEDPYFPQSRNFDWFHGHSFAHGIFPSGDGKNEESSSEDYHSIHALKLLGKVLDNEEMQKSADLQLAIMKTSLNMYMLYSNSNTIQPSQFVGNKVSGILFENKIDFATFFGRGTIGDEFIHGIHMIPITPVSSYIRGPEYVKEEWDAKLKNIVDRIPDGWRGILTLNAGLFDPKYSWKYFARSDWNDGLMDGGMSRTWSLAYLGGIGGAK